jgi:hypothetical protein
VVGALLVWAVVERPAKQAVGIYLVVLAVAAGLFWLLSSPLYGGAYARRRGEALQSLIIGILREPSGSLSPASESPESAPEQAATVAAGKSAGTDQTVPRDSLGGSRLGTELALTRSNGFSVFALWPDTEPYLTPGESHGLSALVTRTRALLASAMAAIAAAAGALAVDADQGWHRYPLVALSAGLLLVAAGSLIRSNWAAGQMLYQKAQLVVLHSTEIIASYDLQVKGSFDRSAALRRLSLSILERSSGLPAPPREQNAIVDGLVPRVASAVGESIETSLQQAFRPPVVANVMGSMSVTLRSRSAESSQLDVTVVTGADAWQAAAGTRDTRFQLSGGEDRPSAPFEVAVDAPGLEITPRQQEAQLPTTNASKSWAFTVKGPWESDVIVWVTLFSSGRYIQAIQLDSDNLERHSGC